MLLSCRASGEPHNPSVNQQLDWMHHTEGGLRAVVCKSSSRQPMSGVILQMQCNKTHTHTRSLLALIKLPSDDPRVSLPPVPVDIKHPRLTGRSWQEKKRGQRGVTACDLWPHILSSLSTKHSYIWLRSFLLIISPAFTKNVHLIA